MKRCTICGCALQGLMRRTICEPCRIVVDEHTLVREARG